MHVVTFDVIQLNLCDQRTWTLHQTGIPRRTDEQHFTLTIPAHNFISTAVRMHRHLLIYLSSGARV